LLVISKTPVRLTLGGGGTDLSSYYSKYGGFVVTSAINKYIYVVVKDRFEAGIRVSYRLTENVNSVNEINHPVVRESLNMLELNSNLEIVSIADMPAKTGLGSSGAFTVGLLNALHAYKYEYLPCHKLAEEACYLEIERLKEPVGKQDQYIAAFGGFLCLNIDRNGTVEAVNLKISEEVARELESSLLFFYTGFQRDSFTVLSSQQKAIQSGADKTEAMHKIKEIGFKVKKSLEKGDLQEFGRLQHEHWLAKRSTTTLITNEQIDRWYMLGLENGALGGKLMGAGGGGFLMFYCEGEAKRNVRKTMAAEGLPEVAFRFEKEGSKIIINV
jgi:D-glycero-alpha-D-manno-heptose-7-phosphate kinase